MRLAQGDRSFDVAVANWLASRLPIGGAIDPYKSVAVLDDEGQIIGAIVMNRCNGWDAELSIYAPGLRWSRHLLRDLFSFCFSHLGLSRLTVHVMKKNKIGRRFVERLGWRLEGVKRAAFPGSIDACIYGLLRDECRFLPASDKVA